MNAADRKHLIESHLKLAAAAAGRVTFTRNQKDPRWQDTFAAACIALCEAADAFDPSRGTQFSTLAWPRVLRAAQRASIRDVRHAKTHLVLTNRGTSPSEDSEEHGLEIAESRTGAAAPSPEALYLDAEAAAIGQGRLSRLVPADRARAEALLAGEPVSGSVYAEKLAARAGLRIASSDRVVNPGPMSGVTRNARWFSRLTPEKLAARKATNKASRARCAQRRALAVAA